MPRIQNAQLSFSAGVLSPRLTLRGDSELHSKALQQGDNWIVTPQGGILFREGSKYIGAPQTNAPFRTMVFRQGGNADDILLELSDQYLRFWQNDAVLADEFTTPYVQADLFNVFLAHQDRHAVLVHGDYVPEYLIFNSDGSIENEQMKQIDVPMIRYKDEKSPGGTGASVTYALTFVNGTTDSWVDGSKFLLRFDYEFGSSGFPEPEPIRWTYSTTTSETETVLLNALRAVFSLQDSAEHTITVTHNAGTTYDIQIDGPNAGRELTIIPVQPSDLKHTVTLTGDLEDGEEPAWSFPYVVSHGGSPNYYKCIASHVSDATTEPGVGGSWTDVWEDLGTTAPDWWAWQHASSNAWATASQYAPWDRGFPKVAVFRQQRLVLMGNKDMPFGLWGSRIGNYRDFLGGANDADPFFFALDTDNSPSIKWAKATQVGLEVGTSAGEFLVTAEVTLGPTDIQAERQNDARSEYADAVMIDTEIFYIEQGKRKIRMTGYQRSVQGFTSTDASVIAEHLIQDPGIKRIARMHTPETMLIALDENGNLVVLSYDRQQQIAAWSPLQFTGDIDDIAVVYSETDKRDYLYMSVTYGSNTYLERVQYPERVFSDDLAVQGVVCMDSWVAGAFSPGPPTIPTQITGLDHLNGQVVGILLDNAWGGTITVSSGKIDLIGLETPPTSYAIGLVYTGTAKSFEPASGNQRGVGFGTDRRWNKLWIRLLDSALPKVNGQIPRDRTPSTPQLTVEGIRTGLQDLSVHNLGYGDGSVTIVQDRPYPTHVLGFFGEYAVENS